MKKKAGSSKFNPSKFEHVYSFGDLFQKEFNTLFADERRHLWMTNGTDTHIEHGEIMVPLKDAQRSYFKKVSLKESLKWYVRCEPFSGEGTGSVALLCEMAAKRLKD